MPTMNHHAIYGVFNRWKSGMRRKLGGTFDWSKVTESDIRRLAESMFNAAQVPSNVRQQYWTEFEKMKAALEK